MFEQGKPSRRSDLFGGQGTVAIWDLLGRAEAPPFSAVLACELEPGASVGKHVQQRDPEIIVGLDGEGAAFVDDKEQRLSPGALVYLPHGATLAIQNASETPLRYLIIKAQSAPEI